MKKLILFLLLPLWAIAQTSTTQEQEFDYGIKNNSMQTITTPPYLTTTGMDGTQGKIPSALIAKTSDVADSLATKENVANKSDSYTSSSSTTYASTAALVGGLETKENVMGAPNYFYYADSFYKADVGISKTSPHNNISGATQKPTNVVLIGDSLMGTMASSFNDASVAYGGFNAIGFNPFYGTNYGTLISIVSTGTVTPVRNDTTSNGSWGVCGSRVDASDSSTITITPASKYRFDAFRLWYNKKSGSGTFTYSIDGGSAVSVDTNNASEVLGVLSIATGISGSSTHTITLTVTAGNVTFYGIDFYNKAQSGFVFHVLQSGGSKATQWAGRTDYARQFIELINPVECVVYLGANDAGDSRTASQYVTDITAIINDLSLPINCAPIIMTPTPRGLTSLGSEDTVFTSLINEYRDSALAASKINSWSFFDNLKYFPSYNDALARDMYIDAVHYSSVGAFYVVSKLVSNLFRGFNNYDFYAENALRKTSILFEPDGLSGISATFNGSDGQKSESGTGFYFTTGPQISYKSSFTKQLVFSNNGLANSILSFFPTTSTPSVLWSFRQNSTSAKAFSIDVVGSATSLSTNNAAFTFNTTGVYSNSLIGIKTTSALAPLHVLGSGTDNITANSDVIQDAVIMGASTTGNTANLSIQSNSTSGIDVGGSIGLGGRFRSSVDNRWATFGIIKGLKENSTDSDSAGYLSFLTKASGGTASEKLKISSTGVLSIISSPTTSAGTYDFLTRNTSTGVVEKVLSTTIAPIASPSFTGTPTAPTAPAGTTGNQIATMEALQAANAGNVKTTGDQTKTGNLTLSGDSRLLSVVSADNETGYAHLGIDALGLPYMQLGTSSNENTAVIRADNINTNSVYQLPNSSGTIALQETVKPYKVYTALLSQTGTNAPVATVLENTLGSSITWTRNDTGEYFGTFDTEIDAVQNKSYRYIETTFPEITYKISNSATTVTILTKSSGVYQDSLLYYTSIEIRVYN